FCREIKKACVEHRLKILHDDGDDIVRWVNCLDEEIPDESGARLVPKPAYHRDPHNVPLLPIKLDSLRDNLAARDLAKYLKLEHLPPFSVVRMGHPVDAFFGPHTERFRKLREQKLSQGLWLLNRH